jgi:hypothetical protein
VTVDVDVSGTHNVVSNVVDWVDVTVNDPSKDCDTAVGVVTMCGACAAVTPVYFQEGVDPTAVIAYVGCDLAIVTGFGDPGIVVFDVDNRPCNRTSSVKTPPS